MENIFYVYLHRRKTDNKVFYVGKGKGNRANFFHNRSKWWNNTAERHGVVVEIVFDNLTEQEAFQCEIDAIAEFRYFGHPLVNLTDGGEGVSGYVMSEETRKRVSEAKKGIRFSEETRLKMSIARKGSRLSEETKKKMSSSQKVLSIKRRRENAKIYTFIEVKTGKIFTGSRYDLADETGFSPGELKYLFRSKANKIVKGWSILHDTKTEEKTEEH